MEMSEEPGPARAESPKATNETNPMSEKYANVTVIYENFLQIASLGDVSMIYRNRAGFFGKKKDALAKPAIKIFLEVPSSRPAVYHYTGLLIHECVHHTFNQKEESTSLGDITAVKDSAVRLLDFFSKYCTETPSSNSLEDALAWLCELSAELAAKNAGRPAMANCHTPEEVLARLKTNEVVPKMLSLVNLVVTSLLTTTPDACMKVMFNSSRHGPHFSWMWLHIATLLQGSIVTHLLASGSELFHVYINEITTQKNVPGSMATLNIIQTEYENKFRAISEVFNYLMRKRNPELQEAVSELVLESLDGTGIAKGRLGFAFFFKLVTCSLKTLQILVTSNSHLITPFNAIRAIRQIHSVDKNTILPNLTFTDFVKQIVEEVDPATHGIVFEMLIELVYNPDVFEGENQPELQEANRRLSEDCFPILDVMMNRIVRISHATGPYKCPSQHPAISSYSSGERLQFILGSISRHIEKSSSVIRHLHAISIANGEAKAAEIALRFLMTISYNETNYMYILMAFINTTVPFYPSMIEYMFREFDSLKTLIEMSIPEEDFDVTKLHLNLIHNLRTLIEWETNSVHGNSHFAHLRIYPGEHIGRVLSTILSDSFKLTNDLFKRQDREPLLSIFRMLTKLIDAVCKANSQTTKNRRVLISISHWYKLMAQFAILFKSTLLLVGRECPEGISVFEELRTAILVLLHNKHVDAQLSPFVPVFMHLFATACFADSKNLFDESVGQSLEVLIDENGINKKFDLSQLEDGPSVINAIGSLRMRDNHLDMLHKGQLKRRRRHDDKTETGNSEFQSEDSKQRIFVVLDALKAFCFDVRVDVNLSNSKQLALALLNSVCKDSLNCDMKFEEWDIEAEFIHRHVEVDRKIFTSSLCDGILRVLCETRSFAYCLPIMKSMLAVVINEAGRFPDSRTLSDAVRSKLHKWVMLAHKGGLLPTRFVYICDLEMYATAHETHLMLIEIWRFLMFRSLTTNSIDTYQEDLVRGDVDEGLPNENEAIERTNMSVFRVILQNHLTEAFHLFPKIFPAEYDQLKMIRLE
ncbi:unnamed protein product [Caenorhabditis sp. 36 PRJEB53466]|nr:unnamed protein product [Caenorhabditis sp. 36 PRJEB53466]